MSLFDRLLSEALQSNIELAPLRLVVGNELLNLDILREMSGAGLLAKLTLVDSSCLRICHACDCPGGDLAFTTGRNFKHSDLIELGNAIEDTLHTRYGLRVAASATIADREDSTTWRINVETRPEGKDLQCQRIHLDICAIPSHDPRPMMLRNLYGVDLGTSGLILQAQSREEILADKMIALAFRKNRLKNRDLWDLGWLVQQGIELPASLIPVKIRDHRRTKEDFSALLRTRLEELATQPALREDFRKEMRRFLPATLARETVEKEAYWSYLTGVVEDLGRKALAALPPAD